MVFKTVNKRTGKKTVHVWANYAEFLHRKTKGEMYTFTSVEKRCTAKIMAEHRVSEGEISYLPIKLNLSHNHDINNAHVSQ